jgi:transcriptional regulator with XRE-family HTH domain
MPNDDTLAALIKALRKARGLTQADAAVRASIARQTLNSYEQGAFPKRTTLARILNALDADDFVWQRAAHFVGAALLSLRARRPGPVAAA